MFTMQIRKALEKKNECAYELAKMQSSFKQDCRELAQISSRVNRRILLDISETTANFGCGILVLDGIKTIWCALSCFDDAADWQRIDALKDRPYFRHVTRCEKPSHQTDRFPTKTINFKGESHVIGAYDRIVDAECKILYSIAFYLDTVPDILNLQGDLFLYTDLEHCSSCVDVIRAFSNEFPSIKMTVFYQRRVA